MELMKQHCKILAVASGGGHWVQLMRLVPAFTGHSMAYATVQPEYAEQVPGARFYPIRDATRWDRWGLIVLGWQLLIIIIRERPDVLITTGAAPGVLSLIIGHWFRVKTIWIDSIANVDSISMSGQHARKVADVWLTQWKHLECQDGPRYEGSVL